MAPHLAFTRLIHSDWSVDSRKRWTAIAICTKSEWYVERVEPTPPEAELLDYLFDETHLTLAGFDFVIGLPSFYIDQIKSAFGEEFVFPDLLTALAEKRWTNFFVVAARTDDISLTRPFYPHRALRGVRREHLVSRLVCTSFDQLLRQCDRTTVRRRAASPLFWTLGPKQVDKAALSGWREVLVPARQRKARLWPFDGALASSASHFLTIAETYPAESYRHVGINLHSGMSKRKQGHRKKALAGINDWCSSNRIVLSKEVGEAVEDGFGARKSGEDPFDAFAGLIAMIEVAEGRRQPSPDSNIPAQEREGWILGQTDLPIDGPVGASMFR
jgi:hypothetical protein